MKNFKKLLIAVALTTLFLITMGGPASALIHPIVSADECASTAGATAGKPSDPPGAVQSGFKWTNANAQAFAHGNSGGDHCQSP